MKEEQVKIKQKQIVESLEEIPPFSLEMSHSAGKGILSFNPSLLSVSFRF